MPSWANSAANLVMTMFMPALATEYPSTVVMPVIRVNSRSPLGLEMNTIFLSLPLRMRLRKLLITYILPTRLFLICRACQQEVRTQVASWGAGSYVLVDLPLQGFFLAMTVVGTVSAISMVPDRFTHKAVGGITQVSSGPAEPALRIKTSSEPPVTFEISAAAWSNFFGLEMSVSTIWMFLRFAASSSSGPAVFRLRMRANTWLFGSEERLSMKPKPMPRVAPVTAQDTIFEYVEDR